MPTLMLLAALCWAVVPAAIAGQSARALKLLGASTQHVLVIADGENEPMGTLYGFAEVNGKWVRVLGPARVVLGRAGVDKAREGDGRSPTGVFPLGPAFGYAEKPPYGTRLPYLPLAPQDQCVDDPTSPFYDTIVDPEGLEGGRSWSSAEWMRRDLHHGDDLYEFGIVVQYGPDRAPGAGPGSCIFLHVRRDERSPTAGCTAMDRNRLLEILAWLDPLAEPVLVQGPGPFLESLAGQGAIPYPLPPAG